MNHDELFALIRTLLETRPRRRLELAIAECHNGRLRDPITTENLHLFRRYRNTVSGDAARMIDEALAAG